MKKLLLLNLFLMMGALCINAQSLDELKAMKTAKQDAAKAIADEIAGIEKQIKEYPGWTMGGIGIVGFDLNSNSNWYAINNPNTTSNGIGLTASAFANNNTDKYFWRNLLSINLKRVNTTLDSSLPDDTAGNELSAITDAIDLSSLFGYKLNDKWAISAEARYASTLLSFNNPGKLTLSAGATWTPIPNLVVIIHPLAYEFNFPTGDYVSAAGAKIGATYAATIVRGIAWSSNLSAFIPYTAGDGVLKQFPLKDDSPINDPQYDVNGTPLSELIVPYTTGDLTNWTWTNSFSTNIFRGIGVGFNIGLRQDIQIANQWEYQRNQSYTPNSENPIQLFYSLGLSYTL